MDKNDEFDQDLSEPHKRVKVESLDEDSENSIKIDNHLKTQTNNEQKPHDKNSTKNEKVEDEIVLLDKPKGPITYTISIVKYFRAAKYPKSCAYIIKNLNNEIIKQKSKAYFKEAKVESVMVHLRKAVKFCAKQKVDHVEVWYDDDSIFHVIFDYEYNRGVMPKWVKKERKAILKMLKNFASHKFKWTLKNNLEDAYKLAKDCMHEWMLSVDHPNKDILPA